MEDKPYRVAFTFKKPRAEDFISVKEAGFTTLIASYTNLDRKSFSTAQKFGLELWVEVGCFVGKELWQKCPHSRPQTKGSPTNTSKPEGDNSYAGVVPLPEVIENRLALIKNLVQNYPGMKALYLDFCRFPGRWENGEGQAIFAENIEPDLTTRQKIITGFVEKAAEICKEGGVSLGIFLTPYDNKEYSQDVGRLASLCRYLSPMLYHKICRKPTSWIGERIGYYSVLAEKSVLPVIQSIPEPSAVSLNEFKESVQQAHQKNSLGLMVLSWEDMSPKMRSEWLAD